MDLAAKVAIRRLDGDGSESPDTASDEYDNDSLSDNDSSDSE